MDLAAPAEVGAGEGVGAFQILGAAVEDDAPATFAGTGAHVEHAVGGQHDRRVVFHHHQGVAGVAQALHGNDDALHVARVQADAGLVEHKERVHQRGAERRGQVDALHLAAAQGAALPVQGEVADADFAQVLQAGADFTQQQLQGLGLGSMCRVQVVDLQGIEKAPQPLQRQAHEVVQAQAGQCLQLRARPLHALGQKACAGCQHGIGLRLAAHAPEQALGLQARAAADAARGVAAVLGQQHADVHLVGLALQVLEETVDAIPLLVPFAVPVRRAVHHPVLLRRRQLVPGRVARNAGGLGVAQQIFLAFGPGRCLQRLDGAGAQRQLVVGDDQSQVDADHAAKAAAAGAGPDGGVEGEQRGNRVLVAQVALRTVQSGRERPHVLS